MIPCRVDPRTEAPSNPPTIFSGRQITPPGSFPEIPLEWPQPRAEYPRNAFLPGLKHRLFSWFRSGWLVWLLSAVLSTGVLRSRQGPKMLSLFAAAREFAGDGFAGSQSRY